MIKGWYYIHKPMVTAVSVLDEERLEHDSNDSQSLDPVSFLDLSAFLLARINSRNRKMEN